MEENISHTNSQKEEGMWQKHKPNNIFAIPTSSGVEFFKWWCIFLRPFINLSNREIDVMASFLNQRWELSKRVSDPAILDEMIMSESIKEKVIAECNLTKAHFYVLMSNLRKNKVIVDDIINPRLIPNVRQDEKGIFQLLILFKDEKK